MNDWQAELLAAVIPALATVLTAVIAWVAKRLDSLMASKIESEHLEQGLRRLNDVVWNVVLELQQTEVDAIKRATSPDSPGGRKITSQEAQQLQNIAVTKVKSYLGDDGLALLKHVFGIDDADMDSYLRTAVESAVRTNKDAFTRSGLEGGKS